MSVVGGLTPFSLGAPSLARGSHIGSQLPSVAAYKGYPTVVEALAVAVVALSAETLAELLMEEPSVAVTLTVT
jgi:hypothetical protein